MEQGVTRCLCGKLARSFLDSPKLQATCAGKERNCIGFAFPILTSYFTKLLILRLLKII